MNTMRVSNSLSPDLGPNCLQRFSADNTSKQKKFKYRLPQPLSNDLWTILFQKVDAYHVK